MRSKYKIYNRLLKKYNASSGFSLLELSVVLLILALLITGGMALSLQRIEIAKKDVTVRRMNNIEKALAVFLAKNGRLPCPASPSQLSSNTTFGAEQISTVSLPAVCITANTDIASANLSSDTLYQGAVPIMSLGLSDSHMLDGWGNKLSYAVQRTFINNNFTNTSCISSGSNALDNHSSNQYFCFKGQASGAKNTATNDIEIRDQNSNLITNNAVYVLISHGANGYGAFLDNADKNLDGSGDGPNTNQNSFPPNANDAEQENLPCNPSTNVCSLTSLNGVYIIKPQAQDFDDIVKFKIRNMLLVECNKYSGNSFCTNLQDIQIN
jgi:prepilin-type N-terminal cleavage/methylation domain-containing protein